MPDTFIRPISYRVSDIQHVINCEDYAAPTSELIMARVKMLLSRRRMPPCLQLIQRLPWRCTKGLFWRKLDRTASCNDRFAAKWRAGFHWKKRS